MKSRMTFLTGALTAAALASPPAPAQEVPVGVLHSLSGTMAISETSLRDVVLMAAEEINEAGGVNVGGVSYTCLLYTSPSPRDATLSRMPSSA